MTVSSRPVPRRAVLQGAASGALLWSSERIAYAQGAKTVSLKGYKRQFFTVEEWAFILAATARLIPSEGIGPGALEAHVPIFIDLQLAGPFGKAADWYMEGPHQPDALAELGFQSPLPPAQIYRQGIAAINAWSVRYGGRIFAELEIGQQDDLLGVLAGGKATSGSVLQGDAAESGGTATPFGAGSDGGGLALGPEVRDFFALLLQNTKEGYFADPRHGGNYRMQAWLHIGFPGARAAYREWPERWDVPYTLGPVSISGERA